MAGGLEGRRVMVPESRELDLFAGMLERQGATTIRCPLVTILDARDPAPIEAWLRRLVAGGFDDLVLYTGEGVRRLMSVAERAGIAAETVLALGRIRIVVRGPKPVRALRHLGIEAEITAEAPTTDGLVQTLSALDLSSRRIGLQAYPGQDAAFDDFLASRGALVDRVVPYRYASDEEDSRVAGVIRSMAEGGIDLVAFTSRPQVRRLREVAEQHALGEVLDRAMARARIAAIGPVCAEAVQAEGWTVAIAPAENFHMKPLIVALRGLFAQEASSVA
ncbi:uroporphyrinogen-III synthase [uncultured Enterovirga sp.]|uniref:uroporphyrinogen-III synthase n=1 Tax=uncultured Enterovirga sp. TaxID=2026352 RepID=UPI0035CB4C12